MAQVKRQSEAKYAEENAKRKQENKRLKLELKKMELEFKIADKKLSSKALLQAEQEAVIESIRAKAAASVRSVRVSERGSEEELTVEDIEDIARMKDVQKDYANG